MLDHLGVLGTQLIAWHRSHLGLLRNLNDRLTVPIILKHRMASLGFLNQDLLLRLYVVLMGGLEVLGTTLAGTLLRVVTQETHAVVSELTTAAWLCIDLLRCHDYYKSK